MNDIYEKALRMRGFFIEEMSRCHELFLNVVLTTHLVNYKKEDQVMKRMTLTMLAVAFSLVAISQTYRGDTRQQTTDDKLNELYCTGMFKSADGVILDVESNPSASTYLNILQWMQGRVAGLQVFTTRMGVSIPMIRNSVAGIYVDEMPVSASYLNSLSVNDIAMVKVIKTPFYGGFNGGSGAIAIYTIIIEEEDDEVIQD